MDKRGSPHFSINYLYFLSFFIVLFILTFSHFLRSSEPHWGTHLFFFIYAISQALLEVFCFILLSFALHRIAPRWTFKIYAGLLFTFLLAHFANFTLVRLMDASLSYFFKFFFGRGLDHFRVAFQSMNMNSTMTAMIVSSIILVPIVGIALYWATHQISLKKPLNLSQKQIFSTAGILALLLLLLDLIAQPYLTCDVHNKYKKTLPLGATFLSPQAHSIPLPATLCKPKNEEILQQELERLSFQTKELPNVYLFVIETLRNDFITPEIAPNLHGFASNHISPNLTFSNANSTHVCWFSIFHSTFPFQWTYIRDEWEQGSIPLQLFKKMGYRIRAYTAADLTYFDMDQILFGKEKALLDSLTDFSSLRIEPCERDEHVIDALMADAKTYRQGTLNLIFLDSTHSEYSSPAKFQPFQPAATTIDYLAISKSATDLARLQNRYRNAIHWVDHLLGRFFSLLKTEHLYDPSLIALTGDHGEEFFEEGALFHGTHLNDWQTRVPILYKFANRPSCPIAPISTHLDIFPTLLHSITETLTWKELVDGESIFIQNRSPYALSVQHNGHDVPYEFSLTNGHDRLQARFINPPFIHTIPSVEVLALDMPDGHKGIFSGDTVCETFLDAFTPFLEKESHASFK